MRKFQCQTRANLTESFHSLTPFTHHYYHFILIKRQENLIKCRNGKRGFAKECKHVELTIAPKHIKTSDAHNHFWADWSLMQWRAFLYCITSFQEMPTFNGTSKWYRDSLQLFQRFGYNESIKFLCLKINVELRLDYGWIFFNWWDVMWHEMIWWWRRLSSFRDIHDRHSTK